MNRNRAYNGQFERNFDQNKKEKCENISIEIVPTGEHEGWLVYVQFRDEIRCNRSKIETEVNAQRILNVSEYFPCRSLAMRASGTFHNNESICAIRPFAWWPFLVFVSSLLMPWHGWRTVNFVIVAFETDTQSHKSSNKKDSNWNANYLWKKRRNFI